MSWKKPDYWRPEKRLADRCLCAGAMALIDLYRVTLSPVLGGACRFYPSCSRYARQAFAERTFFRACWLTARRLARCHPFHPGGYDPLDPESEPSANPSGAASRKDDVHG